MPPDYETFSYEAMATHFAILIAGQPAEYARQASAAAFRELDRLENELSRYVESSDISQANRLAEGESTVIGEDALRCLLIAAQISEATGRAFDPAYASVLPAGGFVDQPLFALDPERHELTSLAPRLHLDLGAVGKGYALDRMADVLREWTIDRACLQSGGSTALVLEAPEGKAGWPLSLGEEPFPRILDLRHRALSGSGVAVKGAPSDGRAHRSPREPANEGLGRGCGCRELRRPLNRLLRHDRRGGAPVLRGTPRRRCRPRPTRRNVAGLRGCVGPKIAYGASLNWSKVCSSAG